MRNISRLKVLLAEKKRTNKWLCERLEVNPITVSKWCTYSSQPCLEIIFKMMEILEVEVGEIINSSTKRTPKLKCISYRQEKGG